MLAGCAGIDHIGIVSDDLSKLEAKYRAMGFRVAPRCELVAVTEDGSIRPLNQHNSHLVFGKTYVELTAVTGDVKGHHLEQALTRYFGFHIIAMLADDAYHEHDRLMKSGIETDAVAIAGRSIDYPSGRGMGRFRWFRIPEREAPEAFLCYVEHQTPELVFDPLLNDHPNGAYELHEVVICTNDPAEAAERLAGICGSESSHIGRGFKLAMRQAAMRLVGPDQGKAEYGNMPMPSLPFAVGFLVRTKDLQHTAHYLDKAELSVRRQPDAIFVEPDQAGQPIVGFVEG